MKNILLIVFMITASNFANAVCSSPISRTAFSSGQVLTSLKLNADLDALYTQVNALPGDCITSESVTSAKITNGTIVNADISSSAAIARTKLSAINVAISTSGSGSFSTASATPVDVTNLTVSITTTGGPVEVYLINEDNLNSSYVGTYKASGIEATGTIAAYRDSTGIGAYVVSVKGASGAVGTNVPPGAVRFYDAPSAGTYTYKLKAAKLAGDFTYVERVKLVVREL